MIFDGYTKDDKSAYMVFINGDKLEMINLLNIRYIEDLIGSNGKLLKTKDGKERIFYEEIKKIDDVKLPDGFEWNKTVYRTTKWFDSRSGYSGVDCYYISTLVNKSRVLLDYPEELLNRLKKACESAEV